MYSLAIKQHSNDYNVIFLLIALMKDLGDKMHESLRIQSVVT